MSAKWINLFSQNIEVFLETILHFNGGVEISIIVPFSMSFSAPRSLCVQKEFVFTPLGFGNWVGVMLDKTLNNLLAAHQHFY